MNDLARIGSAPQTPARFTVDEFMQLAATPGFEGLGKLELVEGVIVRMSPAQAPHMHYKWLVSHRLDEVFRQTSSDYAVHTELSLQLGPSTLRDADVGVLAEFAPVPGYPDPATVLLIVEIAASTLDYDLNVKRLDYARVGIPHYWVVDVAGRRVHAMTTPLDGDYAERRLFAFGDRLPVPGTDNSILID